MNFRLILVWSFFFSSSLASSFSFFPIFWGFFSLTSFTSVSSFILLVLLLILWLWLLLPLFCYYCYYYLYWCQCYYYYIFLIITVVIITAVNAITIVITARLGCARHRRAQVRPMEAGTCAYSWHAQYYARDSQAYCPVRLVVSQCPDTQFRLVLIKIVLGHGNNISQFSWSVKVDEDKNTHRR